mmetsp:Transcript_946/g.2020  ORF Transcript_946/g.2020 Transcript_946/m.2020 type:complete len:112 (-) Transcript_946:282-617(-)
MKISRSYPLPRQKISPHLFLSCNSHVPHNGSLHDRWIRLNIIYTKAHTTPPIVAAVRAERLTEEADDTPSMAATVFLGMVPGHGPKSLVVTVSSPIVISFPPIPNFNPFVP